MSLFDVNRPHKLILYSYAIKVINFFLIWLYNLLIFLSKKHLSKANPKNIIPSYPQKAKRIKASANWEKPV